MILFGTADSNPLIARVLPDLPLRRDGDTWSIGPHRVDATAAVPILIYPNPLNPVTAGRRHVQRTGRLAVTLPAASPHRQCRCTVWMAADSGTNA